MSVWIYFTISSIFLQILWTAHINFKMTTALHYIPWNVCGISMSSFKSLAMCLFQRRNCKQIQDIQQTVARLKQTDFGRFEFSMMIRFSYWTPYRFQGAIWTIQKKYFVRAIMICQIFISNLRTKKTSSIFLVFDVEPCVFACNSMKMNQKRIRKGTRENNKNIKCESSFYSFPSIHSDYWSLVQTQHYH